MNAAQQEFIRLSVFGQQVNAKVDIVDTFAVFDAIGNALKQERVNDEAIISRRHSCFSIACPECSTAISGDKFASRFSFGPSTLEL